MKVENIFKVLIGTVAVLVIFGLVAEWINIFTTLNEIQIMQKRAARQACVLFAQETFKRSGTENIVDDVKVGTATIASSNFYGYTGNDKNAREAIYNRLFLNGNGEKAVKNYVNTVFGGEDNIPWQSFKSWYKGDIYGELYRKNYVTPLNMGITYLDEEVVQNMYKWNLCKMLVQNTNGALVNADTENKEYIDYKGFRIYVNSMTLGKGTDYTDGIKYDLFDLSKETDYKTFQGLTNVGVADSSGATSGSKTYKELVGMTDDKDERNKVVVATINYQASMDYGGITPIWKLISNVTAKGGTNDYKNILTGKKSANINYRGAQINSSTSAQGKALRGGELVYYVIR